MCAPAQWRQRKNSTRTGRPFDAEDSSSEVILPWVFGHLNHSLLTVFMVPIIIRRYPLGMDRLPNREWIRAEEAADYLRVHKATVCAYIKARMLVGRQPKRRGTIYVSTASIRRLLEMTEV